MESNDYESSRGSLLIGLVGSRIGTVVVGVWPANNTVLRHSKPQLNLIGVKLLMPVRGGGATTDRTPVGIKLFSALAIVICLILGGVMTR